MRNYCKRHNRHKMADSEVVEEELDSAQDSQGYLSIYIKLKSRLSVCPSDRPADISAVSAWIDVGLARNESCVFWNHVVCLYESSSTMVRPHKCTKGTDVR